MNVQSFFGRGLRTFAIVWVMAFFAVSAQANEIAKSDDNPLQTLVMLGLAENLGLQSVKIDTLQADREMTVQDARFDPELFADINHGSSRTPVADLSLLESVRSDVTRAETGVRKEFRTGLTSSLSLVTERAENDYDAVLEPSYTSDLQLSIRQPLLRDFGSEITTTELKLSKQRLKQSQYLYLRDAQDLTLQIEIAYFDLVRARGTELLREDSRQLVLELLNSNRAKLEAGFIPVSEVQETETALAERDLRLALARQEREQVALQLNNLLNNNFKNPIQLSERVKVETPDRPAAVPAFDDLYEKALDARPDLQALIIELKNIRLQSDFLDNQTKPQLDFVVTAGVNGLSGDEREGSDPERNSGPYFDSLEGLTAGDGYQWSAGLAFKYPLGNRAAKARSEQARLEERRTDYRKQELSLAIETELRQRLSDLKRTAEQFEIAERLQSLAEITLNQEGRRLEEGLTDTFRVLVFQGTMIDAKIDRLSALVEYNKSLARFSQTMGINLERHGIRAQVEDKEIRFEKM